MSELLLKLIILIGSCELCDKEWLIGDLDMLNIKTS